MTSQNRYRHHRKGYRRAHHLLVTLVAAVLLLTAGVADAAFTTGNCLVSKRKAWSALRKCQATEEVKKLLGKATDFGKCDTKFQEKLAQIDEKAAKAAIACRYGDNGDGTVTDYDTGLQWEKKTGLFVIGMGVICVPGDPVHCVNNTYEWEEAMRFVDATDDGATLTTCFLDHCDWRLPKITELQTILLEPSPCGSSPCIDPIFGRTAASNYWSSTTDEGGAAWGVSFGNGAVNLFSNNNTFYVRAVRGGF